MSFFLEIFDETWWMLLQAAPYILFGLLLAGLIHVLLPESLVLRWMGRPGLSGVVRAAVIGVPLPVCSCGVVPITVELQRKGASRPASQSFLITTPESSVDSIFLTWGMMGPVMAIARPIAAFFTAVLGGVLSIASSRSLRELSGDAEREKSRGDQRQHDHSDHDHSDHDHSDHDHSDHDHSNHDHSDHGHSHHGHSHHDHSHHDHEHSVVFSDSAKARQALRQIFSKDPDTSLWSDLLRPALRYGFGDLLDDLAFWLVIGLALAGVLTATLPDDLAGLGLGDGLLPMILMLVVGIPLYMCASASTPIAAALLAKGVSPGAALVFLLAGPATNAATVLLLAGTFGRRFVWIYVVSVALGALAAGLLLDALLTGETAVSEAAFAGAEPGGFSTLAALLLIALLARSLWRGGWNDGVSELQLANELVLARLPRLPRGFLAAGGVLLAIALYLATGLRIVPADSRGYSFRFGALHRADLGPGLHYVPPAPFGAFELRRVHYMRKTDVGFRTDIGLLARRRELVRRASRDEWHCPVAAMNANPVQATYLTADENLVEMSFSVHWTLSDPVAFFFGVNHREDFVGLYAEAVARELVASTPLDDLLTERRPEVEGEIQSSLQELLDASPLGVEIRSVQIVDIHPPGDAVFAFRDVSSALEDRETRIYEARQRIAQAVPRARGEVAQIVAEAEAEAETSVREATGSSESFLARAEPYQGNRDLVRHLIWIESAEKVLGGREKYIVPPGTGSRGVTLWKAEQPPFISLPEVNR